MSGIDPFLDDMLVGVDKTRFFMALGAVIVVLLAFIGAFS